MELLMLYHVFSSEELVFFKYLYTELLSAQHTSSLHYFSSEIHSESFGIKMTRELVAHVRPLTTLFRFSSILEMRLVIVGLHDQPLQIRIDASRLSRLDQL